MKNTANAKVGDYVTANVNLNEPYPTQQRQGIYTGGTKLQGELETYEIEEIIAVVPDRNLFRSTVSFVRNWRKRNL